MHVFVCVYVCVCVRVCMQACMRTRARAHSDLLPPFPSLFLSHRHTLSPSLSLHNHFPSLPECLMESGEETKDDFISKREPALTPLSLPHRLFPYHSESGFGKVLSPRREKDTPPLPLCSLQKGVFCHPCSVVIGSLPDCQSPVLLAATSQLGLGGTEYMRPHNWLWRHAGGWRVPWRCPRRERAQ